MLLDAAVSLERLDHNGRHRQNPPGAARLGRAKHHAIAANPLQCLPHPQLSRAQVDIRPPQPKEFTTSQTKSQRDDEQGMQPVRSRCCQECAGFGLSPGVDFLAVRGGCLHQPSDVAGKQLLAHGLTEHCPQHRVNLLNRSRRHLGPLVLGLTLPAGRTRCRRLGEHEPDMAGVRAVSRLFPITGTT
jgi:hypothetical protein